MGKSCFIKLVVILTILIASILYIIENKFDDIFLNPGKKFLTLIIEDNWETELSYIANTNEKDSLKSLIHFYVDGIKSLEEISENKNVEMIEFLEMVFKDSIITKNEISQLTKIIKSLRDETTKNN